MALRNKIPAQIQVTSPRDEIQESFSAKNLNRFGKQKKSQQYQSQKNLNQRTIFTCGSSPESRREVKGFVTFEKMLPRRPLVQPQKYRDEDDNEEEANLSTIELDTVEKYETEERPCSIEPFARSTKCKELWAVSPYMMEYDLSNA